MSGIFDAVREIPCIDAAEKLGWRLKRHGRRAWTQCPFHGEKTASLCLYEGDRGFYCFGCHEGGDAVRLYEKALGVSPAQAATQLAADFGIAAANIAVGHRRAPNEYNLRRALEKKRADRCRTLSGLRWEADARLVAMARGAHAPEAFDRFWDDPDFCRLLMARSRADDGLDLLDNLGTQELLEYFQEVDRELQ